MKTKWFQMIVMFILMVAMPSWALAAPAGKVTQTEGSVDITRAGTTAAKALLPGESVGVGDTIRTKSKSKAEIIFSDQNTLRIAASSRITIQKYMVEGENTTGMMKLHRGMAQAVSSVGFIKRLVAAPEQNKLEIQTINATCGIRGSNMIVSYHGGVTSVVFVTGHGYAYNPGKPDVVVSITAGNISTVEKKDAAPTQPRPVSEVELDVKVKAVTPGEKSRSELEQKQDGKAQIGGVKDQGKSSDAHGLGKAPTDAADLPSGLVVKAPGQAAKTLDLKTADRTIKTQAAKSASPGKSVVQQSKSDESSGGSGGGSGGSGGSGSGGSGSGGSSSSSGGSAADVKGQYLKDKKKNK